MSSAQVATRGLFSFNLTHYLAILVNASAAKIKKKAEFIPPCYTPILKLMILELCQICNLGVVITCFTNSRVAILYISTYSLDL